MHSPWGPRTQGWRWDLGEPQGAPIQPARNLHPPGFAASPARRRVRVDVNQALEPCRPTQTIRAVCPWWMAAPLCACKTGLAAASPSQGFLGTGATTVIFQERVCVSFVSGRPRACFPGTGRALPAPSTGPAGIRGVGARLLAMWHPRHRGLLMTVHPP